MARKWDSNFPDADLGTTTEQAFDVVHLDTSRRTLDFTRIGRGQSRSFTF